MKDKALFTKQEVLDRIGRERAAGKALRADFNLAAFIAHNALMTQRDYGGRDYGQHMARVALHNDGDDVLMVIGLLHDVVEDSDWTGDDLRAAGFSERIVSAVDALSHREGEKYFDSIARVAANPDAIAVKLGDLRDNMALSRMTRPDERHSAQLERYVVAYNYLLAIRNGDIAATVGIRDFIRMRPALDGGPAFWARHSAQPYDPAPRPLP